MHVSLRPSLRRAARAFDDDSDETFTDGPLKGKTVRVRGGAGVAHYVLADDGADTCVVVMVGDDHQYAVDREDCVVIGDLDYCAECGQIGCAHDGRDRSDEEPAE